MTYYVKQSSIQPTHWKQKEGTQLADCDWSHFTALPLSLQILESLSPSLLPQLSLHRTRGLSQEKDEKDHGMIV